MIPNTLYLGVDIAKSHLDLEHQRYDNTPAQCQALLKALPAHTHLVVEATGGYERVLLQAAWAQQVPISVVSPRRVRAFARSRGRLAKTDQLDAKLLSAFGHQVRPTANRPPHPLRARLRNLLRVREHLRELQRIEANHREHLDAEASLQKLLQERTSLLDEQVGQLESQIRRLVKGDQTACAEMNRLRAVSGIGEITAWTVWAELPELGTLAPGQAAALAGLAPYARDSGQRSSPRFIHGGRSRLRRVLYMAALTAARHNHVLKVFYTKLRNRGKPAKVALIAVARKLIELLNLISMYPNFRLA